MVEARKNNLERIRRSAGIDKMNGSVYTQLVLNLNSKFFTSLLFNERRLRPGWRIMLFLSMMALVSGISLFPLVALILTTWFMVRFVDRRPLASVGLLFERAMLGQLLFGMMMGAGLLGSVVVLAGGFGNLQVHPGHLKLEAFSALLFYIVIHFNVAVFEEMLARGYLLQTLLEGMGAIPALLVSALGFTLFHFDNPNLNPIGLINLSLAGIFLGLLVLKTKSLWPAIGFHFAWNFTQSYVLGLPVSGITLNEYWIQIELEGPTWLTGGAFGPEGSLLTSVALLGSTLWIWKSTWLRPSSRSLELWKTHLHPNRKYRFLAENSIFPNQ